MLLFYLLFYYFVQGEEKHESKKQTVSKFLYHHLYHSIQYFFYLDEELIKWGWPEDVWYVSAYGTIIICNLSLTVVHLQWFLLSK